jgi:hypothetical protein
MMCCRSMLRAVLKLSKGLQTAAANEQPVHHDLRSSGWPAWVGGQHRVGDDHPCTFVMPQHTLVMPLSEHDMKIFYSVTTTIRMQFHYSLFSATYSATTTATIDTHLALIATMA